MGKRLTDAEKLEVVNLSRDGITAPDIAEHMGVSDNTVYGILRRHKMSPRRASTFMDVVDVEKIVADYLDFYPLTLVASRNEISVSQVYYVLRQEKIPARSKGVDVVTQRGEMLDTAVRMYQDGFYLYEIKEETGVHQPTLHQALHERKIPLRRPRGRVTPSQLTEAVRSHMEEADDS